MSASEPLFTRTFALLSASHFLHALSFHLFLHLPGFFSGIGAGELDIGLLAGAASAAAILARPAIGRVMDESGRRPIVWLGGVLGILACTAYLTVDKLGPFVYLVRITHGLSEAMLFASLFAFAADIVPASRRIEGIGLFGVSGMLPMALGGALGDAILAHASYQALFTTAAGASVVATLLSIPLSEPPRAEGERPRGLSAALFDRSLTALWFGGLCFATAIGSYFSFLKTFVLERDVGQVGSFFAAYSLIAVAIRVLFGRVPERVGPKRVLSGALISLLAGLLLLSTASAAWQLIVAGLLCGLGHGWAFPILLGLVIERARPTERGAALAIYTALFDAGVLLGGPLFGAVIESLGYRAMFLSAAALVVAGIAILKWWDVDRHRPRSSRAGLG